MLVFCYDIRLFLEDLRVSVPGKKKERMEKVTLKLVGVFSFSFFKKGLKLKTNRNWRKECNWDICIQTQS